MEQCSGTPGQGRGVIVASPCERLLGDGGCYDNALRILGRQQFLPRPHPRPRRVCPPPSPTYAAVVVVIMIAIVVPSAHLPSSSSPPPEFAPPDATWRRGTARRDRTGSGLARQGGDDYLLQ